MMVLGIHLFNFYPFSYITRMGWLGVDLFFVLSGFLITKLLCERQITFNIVKAFIVRRVLRIFPIYFLFLFLIFIVGGNYFSRVIPLFSTLLDNQIFFWTYLQNYFFLQHHVSNFINPLWSLAVEEHFYLIWPFALWVFTKNRIILSIVIITLILLLRVISNNTSANYVATHLRADALIMGSVAAFLILEKIIIPIKYMFGLFFILTFSILLIILLNPTFLPTDKTINTFGFTLFDLLFSVIIYGAITYRDKFIFFVKILESKFLTFLGKYSYGIYLFHWPLLKWTDYSYKLEHSFMNDLGKNILILIITIILAVISFEAFENKFLKLKVHFKYV